MASCPICHKPVLPRGENPCFPFCSGRCRLVDLGHWLDGDYGIAAEESDAAEENEAPPSSDAERPKPEV